MTEKITPRQQEILDKIVPMIAECGPDPSDVKMDANFSYDLGLDSVDQVQLVVEIERDLNVVIPEETQKNIQTVGDLVKAIDKNDPLMKFLVKRGPWASSDFVPKSFRTCVRNTDKQKVNKMAENKYKADVEALFDESHGGRKDSAKEIQSDGGGKEKKDRKKHLTQGQRTGILFMSWGLFIIAIGIIDYVDFKKTQRVNKQVKAFEKTLPAEYLEYKQAVEHYRDSLMHANSQ